ncbi:hypothetical protein GW17_00007841 [Ensete ventricosum]|nr:hypothetical protein GW17_00007841 [Ensete ventricosum]
MLQVFRLVSLWFNFYCRQNVVEEMISTVKEARPEAFPFCHVFVKLKKPVNMQIALVSLIRKMAFDHPYHTIFQVINQAYFQ